MRANIDGPFEVGALNRNVPLNGLCAQDSFELFLGQQNVLQIVVPLRVRNVR